MVTRRPLSFRALTLADRRWLLTTGGIKADGGSTVVSSMSNSVGTLCKKELSGIDDAGGVLVGKT